MMTKRNLLALLGFLALTAIVSGVSSYVTMPEVKTWYVPVVKPPLNPPDWVFGPVWTTLYIMIAVSGWLVWKARGFAGARAAFAAYGMQLALNFAWSLIFFGLHRPGIAFADITLLWCSILATIVLFWRIRPLAGYLLVPYLLWVSFASYLNYMIWHLNP